MSATTIAKIELSRDQCRELFATSGLNYSCITKGSIKTLRQNVDFKMKESGLFSDSFRANKAKIQLSKYGDFEFAEVRCKGFYFDDREAVSFNRDGFIGFAGWASDANVQPILAGFCEWLADLRAAE